MIILINQITAIDHADRTAPMMGVQVETRELTDSFRFWYHRAE